MMAHELIHETMQFGIRWEANPFRLTIEDWRDDTDPRTSEWGENDVTRQYVELIESAVYGDGLITDRKKCDEIINKATSDLIGHGV